MSKFCLLVHLTCSVSFICSATRTCNEQLLDKSSRIWIRREYGTAARNALQVTEIDSSSIDLFRSCVAHDPVPGVPGQYSINLAVISFNIPSDYLDNSGDAGYTGRVNARCRNGNWLFEREDLPALLSVPGGVCASCNTDMQQPCQPCLLNCEATQDPSPDCKNCEAKRPVTVIHTLSRPPWVTTHQQAETTTQQYDHTTKWIGTTRVVTEHEPTHEPTQQPTSGLDISTIVVTTAPPTIKTLPREITTTANHIPTKPTTEALNSTAHFTTAVLVTNETETHFTTTALNATEMTTTALNATETTTALLNGTETLHTPTADNATLAVNFTNFSTARYPTIPSSTNATTEAFPFTTGNFTTASLTPNTTTEVLTTNKTEGATTVVSTTPPVVPPTHPPTPPIVPDNSGDSDGSGSNSGDGDDDTHIIVIDNGGDNNDNEGGNDGGNDGGVEDEDSNEVYSGPGPTVTTCIEEGCLNGGEGLCRNGVFQECLCAIEYTGTFCEIMQSSKVFDGRSGNSFWDWKLSKYIIGGLGVFLLIGVLMSICMIVRCVRSSGKERHQDSYYDVGMETFLPSAPVVIPPSQHPQGSYRGSSDVLDETRSEEEFPLHDSDHELDMISSSDQIQLHRSHGNHHHDHHGNDDLQDDGLLHHAPSHRISPEHYKVPTPKIQEYMNLSHKAGREHMNGHTGREYMNGNSNTYSHKINKVQPDVYAHLNRSYSRNASHNYLNIP